MPNITPPNEEALRQELANQPPQTQNPPQAPSDQPPINTPPEAPQSSPAPIAPAAQMESASMQTPAPQPQSAPDQYQSAYPTTGARLDARSTSGQEQAPLKKEAKSSLMAVVIAAVIAATIMVIAYLIYVYLGSKVTLWGYTEVFPSSPESARYFGYMVFGATFLVPLFFLQTRYKWTAGISAIIAFNVAIRVQQPVLLLVTMTGGFTWVRYLTAGIMAIAVAVLAAMLAHLLEQKTPLPKRLPGVIVVIIVSGLAFATVQYIAPAIKQVGYEQAASTYSSYVDANFSFEYPSNLTCRAKDTGKSVSCSYSSIENRRSYNYLLIELFEDVTSDYLEEKRESTTKKWDGFPDPIVTVSDASFSDSIDGMSVNFDGSGSLREARYFLFGNDNEGYEALLVDISTFDTSGEILEKTQSKLFDTLVIK